MAKHEIGFAIATGDALLIVRPGNPPQVEPVLPGKAVECVAVDPADPTQMLVGSWGFGLWRSSDGGRTWSAAGEGVPHQDITAVAIAPGGEEQSAAYYAGTEPSTFSRSNDRGLTWLPQPKMLDLPSASRWSFPPKPHTHHVRWIEVDPHRPETLYVAIEAGALLRTHDAGRSWQDRVDGGPIDTHSAATHPTAGGWIVSAAGDGYFESADGGDSWSRPMAGLNHRYLVGVACDPHEATSVVVSAAAGPYVAYRPRNAESYLYRKTGTEPFALAMHGLPPAEGSVASRLATSPGRPGEFWAANNHGLFHSSNGGSSWKAVAVDWPAGAFRHGVRDLKLFSV